MTIFGAVLREYLVAEDGRSLSKISTFHPASENGFTHRNDHFQLTSAENGIVGVDADLTEAVVSHSRRVEQLRAVQFAAQRVLDLLDAFRGVRGRVVRHVLTEHLQRL